jgi:hypothetical protein
MLDDINLNDQYQILEQGEIDQIKPESKLGKLMDTMKRRVTKIEL